MQGKHKMKKINQSNEKKMESKWDEHQAHTQ
jgi:hypothetical protein